MGRTKKSKDERMEFALTNPYNVQVGQVWKNNDPRMSDVGLKVVEISNGYARLVRTWNPDERGTLIRLDRMKPTRNGFVLLQEAPPRPPTHIPFVFEEAFSKLDADTRRSLTRALSVAISEACSDDPDVHQWEDMEHFLSSRT